MLNPNDLLNTKFEKKMGGYKAADVDNFMVEAASLYSQQIREIADLKRKLEVAHTKIESYETDRESLKEALLSAQKLADKIVHDARAQALSIEHEAEEKAQQVLQATEQEIVSEKERLAQMKREVSAFRSKVMNMYRAHIELINDIPTYREETAPEEAPAQAPVQQPEPPAPEPAPARHEAEPPIAEPPAVTASNEAAASIAPAPVAEAEPDPEPPTPADDDFDLRLNVRYDEETGEYVPLDPDRWGEGTGRKR